MERDEVGNNTTTMNDTEDPTANILFSSHRRERPQKHIQREEL
jgi:hypothetical protein